jgi:hypothetical protein
MASPRLILLVAAFVISVFPVRAQNSFGFRKVSSWPGVTRGTPADVIVIDNYAYIAMAEGGLCIVDVTSKTAPIVSSRLDLPGNATRIKISGDYAFLSCGAAGLQIVNVANPSAPILTGSFDTAGTAQGMGFAYPYAFIADGANGVVVADITNPAAPTFATQINLPGTVYDLEAEMVTSTDINTQITTTNRYLQVVNGTNGFLAYRVTNPFSPELREHDVAKGWDARAITRYGTHVYWTERNFITHSDFLSPPDSKQVGIIENFNATAVTKLVVGPVRTPAMQLSPSLHLFSGSLSYDTFASLPSVSAFLRPSTEAGMADPGDGYMYFLDNAKGLTIYNSSRVLVSSTPIGAEASRIKVAGDRLYVANGQQGLEILQIGSDGQLTSLSRFVDQRTPGGFDVAGSNVFGWFGDTNLNILDVTNASQPTLLTNAARTLASSFTTLAGRDVAVQNGYAYVADAQKISALDITNPARPVLVGQSLLPASLLNSIGISGTNIIGADLTGLFSIGVNPDKSFTVLQRLATTSRGGRRVKLAGTTAYVCERAGGLKIYDVSDPTNIVALASYDTPGNAFSVALSGSMAYVADQQDGVLALDVSNPTNPTLVAILPMSNSPLDIEVRDNRLFVAQGAEGVSVWDMVPRQAQTIDFPAIADKAVTNAPFVVTAKASSGLPIQFEVVSGPATVVNDTITLEGSGSVTIRATQSGNDEFGAIFAERTFNVAKAAQTIIFPPISDKTTRDNPFPISAISNVGLPVHIVCISDAAGIPNGAINTTTVTILSAGTVTIRATQDGDNRWLPATIERTFTIIDSPRASQTIDIPPISVVSVDDDPFPLPISASSGLPVTVTVTGPAFLQDGIITVNGQGSVTIRADQAGNADYLPAALTRTFTVYDLPEAATANVLALKPALPAAETSPDADPDHDGLPNIVEFILKSDPTSATSLDGHISATVFEAGGSRYLKVRYLKPRTLRYPVGIQIGDLARYPRISWVSVPVGFNDDGTGEFFWAINPAYAFPVIRFAVQYP